MTAPARSPLFDVYWRFAAERHAVYLRRVAGDPPPWTADPVLTSWRFTNAYRAADRVSQYLIREVIYAGDQDPHDVVFRVLLFKWFNKISTWEMLTDRLGPLRLATFDPSVAERVLSEARANGATVYSAAYIVPPIREAPGPKHSGHLTQIVRMLDAGLAADVVASESLEDLYRLLRGWSGLGDFLAYQFAIDLNYSAVVDHDENEFVVAGPGARDGIAKVWPGANLRDAPSLIAQMVEEQHEQFARLGLDFPGLFGRDLKLIDCQNLFCEISKYARVAHSDVQGIAGRTRIKQAYRPGVRPAPVPPPYFPPKWGLSVPDGDGQMALAITSAPSDVVSVNTMAACGANAIR
ncbi:MAG TPA: nucleotide kinase domain-containing protein [Frankiaceae bacterium]|nr:nucleotide kinase domain-containing protein [Frankiaceae bacterium]